MIAILPLLLLTGLGNFIGTPPRDLASLLEPKTVLEKLEAKTDEASLLEYLIPKKINTRLPPPAAQLKTWVEQLGAADFKTRNMATKKLEQAGAAASPFLQKALSHKDPELKVSAQKLLNKIQDDQNAAATDESKLYLRDLMAIRLLAQLKSAKAVPLLKVFAKTATPTLADAALNAINVIEGKPEVRPEVKGLILDAMSRISLDTSFVIALDMTSGAKTVRAVDMIKELAKDPGMAGGMLPPNQLQQMEPEVIKGIMTALQTVGNVRVDAVFMTFSGSFGANEGARYMSFIIKGLYDPKLVENLIIDEGELKPVKLHGKTVFNDGDALAICCFDENTMLISVAPDGGNNGLHIEPLIQAFTKPVADDLKTIEAVTKRLPKLTPAVTGILAGKVRLGIAGSLSDVQRAEAKTNVANELERVTNRLKNNPNPNKELEKTSLEMIAKVIDADRYQATITTTSGMTLDVICKSPEDAAALEKNVAAFDKGLRDMLQMLKGQMAGQGGMPPQFKKIFDAISADKPLFPMKRTDKSVSVEIDFKQLTMFQSLMFLGMRM